ncbi:MAG: hypothetical protein DDT28_00187 [Dehalococcoidia bacterium]|nr:hypothetical protein [Chloroflexota bacterium]MBT9159706.1 hypothetical protein [Chloroflexota bacterium]
MRPNSLDFLKFVRRRFQNTPKSLEFSDGLFRLLFAVLARGSQGEQQFNYLVIMKSRNAGSYELLAQPLAVTFHGSDV